MRITISFDLTPFSRWFEDYDKSKFTRDVIAGLTVAAVLVPQGMAYALLAGMPPIYGLYASVLPVMVAALFGSSRFLATGPVAMTALLTSSALYGLAEPGSQQWIAMAGMLAIMVGVIRLAIGLAGIAFFIELISNSVIVGFTSAGALVIALSQAGHLLGFKITQSTHIYEVIVDIFSKISQVNPYTLLVGVLAYLIIYVVKRINKLLPGALAAVVITSLLSYFLNLQQYGVALVGDVPVGLPSFGIEHIDYKAMSQLWAGALVIAAFGLIEAVAIAKQLAIRVGDKWDPNQELIGQGLANITAGFFKGFPIGGSFSRSALNFQLGAKSPLASVITSSVVALTLVLLAPLFYYLPKATLSAVVLSAVISLIKPQEIVRLYKINPTDGVVAGLTFSTVFFMDLWVAISLGTIVAFGSFVYKTMYPRIVVLTRNPASSTFVNAERENIPECPQILYIRPSMSLYFGNTEYVFEYIIQKVSQRRQGLKFVLLDFEAVNYIDASGSLMLIRLLDKIRSMGVEPAIANIGCHLYPLLEKAQIDNHVSVENIFESKGKSIEELFKKLDHQFCARRCPHVVFRECLTVKNKNQSVVIETAMAQSQT
ncbi:MAG: SulP family inorganic anion transporter [Aquificaceae bacterium]|nr:SulP family inorganic anion transporter [Aquificaceae bacterium]MDW8236903.1 SulP family inorganic anion transporter [Aquificaceae bacterium]